VILPQHGSDVCGFAASDIAPVGRSDVIFAFKTGRSPISLLGNITGAANITRQRRI
jgi:hypothetical protein